MEQTKNKEKLSFAEWVENMWYHYKWLIIFGALIVIFLAVSLYQCATYGDPDVNIIHVGPNRISPESMDRMQASMKQLADDYNDDGEFNLAILDITINKFGNESAGIDVTNYDFNQNGFTRFQTEIRAGDAVIYLLDKEYFDMCIADGLLVPLEDVVDDAYLPENVIDGYGVYLSDLDVYELDGFCDVPSTAILCLRRMPKEGETNYKNLSKVWDGNKKAFVNMFKYESKNPKPENSNETSVVSE